MPLKANESITKIDHFFITVMHQLRRERVQDKISHTDISKYLNTIVIFFYEKFAKYHTTRRHQEDLFCIYLLSEYHQINLSF